MNEESTTDRRSRAHRMWHKRFSLAFLTYSDAMIHCHDKLLTAEERHAHDEWASSGWQASFPGQSYPGDRAWPGWRKYLGAPPRPDEPDGEYLSDEQHDLVMAAWRRLKKTPTVTALIEVARLLPGEERDLAFEVVFFAGAQAALASRPGPRLVERPDDHPPTAA